MTNESIIDIRSTDDAVVVSFKQPSIGAAEGVENIRHTLRQLLQNEQPGKLIIDFSGVVFFSSQMLGLLVDLWRRMKDAGGTLLISGINPQLTRVFRITHLDRIFDFYEDTDAAVAALRVSS